jgi:hypothetical protein
MRNPRTHERYSGLASGIAGLLALAFEIFAPWGGQYASESVTVDHSNRVISQTFTSGHSSRFQQGISPTAWYFFGLLALVYLGIIAAATLHSRTGNNAWRTLLWIATGLLISGVLLSFMTLLWLSALLALYTTAMSLLTPTGRWQSPQDAIY